MAVREFNILTPNAMLGYGYRLDHFWYGIEKYKPKAIIVDSGSTDGGPYKLGLNKMTCGRGSYIRDLTPILQACFHNKIKVLIGSVGGDGSTKHVQEFLDIVQEISCEHGMSFKIATIDAGVSRDLVRERIRNQRVHPCGPVEPLTEEAVEKAVDIVAQMGAEPYLEALKLDPDIILGGRSYDPAPFAAFSMHHGVSAGTAWHMGKIMECGGICAVPKGRSMIATMRQDSFDLTPLSGKERCTPLSVAAHTLYEKTRPDLLPGPGGILSLDNASYEQITEKTVRVRGAIFQPSQTYQIKLEGVQKLGYRTIFIGGIRDPILISQIDEFLEAVRKYTQNLFPELDKSEECKLLYHIYGRDAVMGPLECQPTTGHEIGVLGEVVAPTQELSYTIANNARASILHFPYKGQIATTGNFASPLSPHEIAAGAVFRFSLYHLVDLVHGEEVSLFPVTMHDIKSTSGPAEIFKITEKEMKAIDSEDLEPLVFKKIPEGECALLDIATIIRSKNSGPFELTLDVMCDTKESFQRLQNANILTNECIKNLYHVKNEDIITNMYFEPALAWKCTIKRPWPQGSVGERDTLGTQQHAPLLYLKVPAPVSHEKPLTNGIHFKGTSAVSSGILRTNGDGKSDMLGQESLLLDRTSFQPVDTVKTFWKSLDLPCDALASLHLEGEGIGLPSSFKIAHLAQSSIAISALTAALIYSLRTSNKVPQVTIPLLHASIEFKSERLYSLAGKGNPSPWGPIGGLHKTSDGYVRIHDSFPNHRDGAKTLLGCPPDADRKEVAAKAALWTSIDLESAAADSKLVISALRSYNQWDVLPQARAISSFPIIIHKIAPGPPSLPRSTTSSPDKCLRGLRVLEMSRVIAAPLAGKTLAVHGADVLWITSANLPDLPTMDRDFARGKRTTQLDIEDANDLATLRSLAKDADVFIQGFRPGSLASKGLSPGEVSRLNPNGMVIGNMSAYGSSGPWAKRRGFDSLVQTCSGMNISEAEHFGDSSVLAMPTPCQALDHAGGYFLAAGITAALYKRATEGGSYEVEVSLAGVMKYLRSLGQFEGDSGFKTQDYEKTSDVPEDYLETRESGFGTLTAVKHSAKIEGVDVGWNIMPKPLGSDEASWLE